MKPINFMELLSDHLGGLSPAIIGTWIVMGLLLVFAVMARRALAEASDPMTPDDDITLRGFGEVLTEWLDGFVANVSELHGSRRFVPFFGSIFIFILMANFFGIIPGMEPPTGDTDLTFALGAICFAFYLYQGFKSQGAELSQELSRTDVGAGAADAADRGRRQPVSALFARRSSLRQYVRRPSGAGLFTRFTYLVVPLAFYALGSLVCVVQALVFTILSITYVRMASASHH